MQKDICAENLERVMKFQRDTEREREEKARVTRGGFEKGRVSRSGEKKESWRKMAPSLELSLHLPQTIWSHVPQKIPFTVTGQTISNLTLSFTIT
jgi:hypothetical protein